MSENDRRESGVKTGILIHGCHLQAEGWEEMIWGKPTAGVLGRVPRGLELLENEQAGMLYFGTGASEKDGLKESEYIFRYTLEHAHTLPQFSNMNADDLASLLKSVSFIDTTAQNTSEEIEGAAKVCQVQGIGRLLLVSSPTHIPRCLLTAEKLRGEGKLNGIEIFATASDVSYEGYGPADVVIAEPPHRGDRPKVPIHEPLARANKLGRGERAGAFVEALNNFLDDWDL